MPRGVKGSGKAKPTRKPKTQARAKAAPKAPQASKPVQSKVTTASAPQVASSPFAPANEPPLASVDVDKLAGDALRRYARRAGVPQRDVDNLTEDRLKQNVKLTIARHFDLITEGA